MTTTPKREPRWLVYADIIVDGRAIYVHVGDKRTIAAAESYGRKLKSSGQASRFYVYDRIFLAQKGGTK